MINDSILINYITNNFFSSRTYWLSDDRQNKFWLVDCGDIEKVVRQIPAQSVIAGVLLTHVHFDHILIHRVMMRAVSAMRLKKTCLQVMLISLV